ncbi:MULTISPECIES: hypothetical protein [unclassified Microcoleus]|uniref:hypothetical protein n=1 Tax=unclassified Microcoleus TaxID=2642155 RepID=UPI0025D01956|nr:MULTISPECIES: hypothetical protein [unclassified Microcoleus]
MQSILQTAAGIKTELSTAKYQLLTNRAGTGAPPLHTVNFLIFFDVNLKVGEVNIMQPVQTAVGNKTGAS